MQLICQTVSVSALAIPLLTAALGCFTIAYIYEVNTDGSLATKYEMDPKIETVPTRTHRDRLLLAIRRRLSPFQSRENVIC